MNRQENIEFLKNTPLDLLIIGGGITGAGIALDASLRGLKVGLIEMNDFASGTSSKSTKLIHGGLRYLKQMDFSLVTEVGRERAIVHKNAPHLVLPEKMILPLIQNGNYSKWMTHLGLRVYDWLAKVDSEDKMKMLDKKEVKGIEPLLASKHLVGGAIYAEYRTDDVRLTMSVLKSANQKGAGIANYVKALEFKEKKGKLTGILAYDSYSEETFEIRAKTTVNATGPWTDEVRKKNGPIEGKYLHHTKGVHLVFKKSKIPLNQTVYFDNNDQRMIFAIPRLDRVYVGTTDTNYSGDLNDIRVSAEDALYLLEAINNNLKIKRVDQSDIISSWAGVRPLIHEKGKSPSELSRKDEIFIDNKGLITITGGKLTGYRKMAERVMEKVLDKKIKKNKTETFILSGSSFKNFKQVKKYIAELQLDFPQFSDYDLKNLVFKYGKNASEILNGAHNKEDLVLHELKYTVAFEMCTSLLDFFERRSGILYFYPDQIDEFREQVTAYLTKYFKWDSSRINRENKSLDEAMENAISFK